MFKKIIDFKQGAIIEIHDYAPHAGETANAALLREYLSEQPAFQRLIRVSSTNKVLDIHDRVELDFKQESHWLLFGGLFNNCLKGTMRAIMYGFEARGKTTTYIHLPLFAINTEYIINQLNERVSYPNKDKIPELIAGKSKSGSITTGGELSLQHGAGFYFDLDISHEFRAIISKDDEQLRVVNDNKDASVYFNFYSSWLFFRETFGF
jgi:hypothetical protein